MSIGTWSVTEPTPNRAKQPPTRLSRRLLEQASSQPAGG